jgi:MtrB/PioB family decaheme-associated outer membrane protein
MTTFSPLFLLSALGALSAAASGALAAEPSQWKCETCPFDKAGTSGTLDVGLGAVSDDSAKFGDYTGLNQKGAYLVAGGAMRYRGEDGQFGSLKASDLGLDARSLAGEYGKEGLYTLRLGYSEIPHYLTDTAMTPFLGNGGGVLTLPAGFPAVDTGSMPLASTLQPVELGFKRSRLDASASWLLGQGWSTRLSLRHDVKDGTQRTAGSFFSTASQMAAPVDQVTDQVEISASYFSQRLQATLAYQGSLFRNGQESLTWTNPFSGVRNGQLALAPDNESHQIFGSAAYEITPKIRASGEFAVGRMTQDAAFLAATLNVYDPATNPSGLVVPALPAQSLSGQVDTFNASVRLTATPIERLLLNASYARDVRDNQTPSLAYPAVSTDMFLGAVPRINQPFSFTQDRFKVSADYRWQGSTKTSVGVDQNYIQRTLQEVVTTRETTLWGQLTARPLANTSLMLELAHSERDNEGYGIAAWITPPENPLLRKYNLADRTRDKARLRADFTASESVNFGVSADVADDNYGQSSIGLTDGRSVSYGADVSWAITDQTQLSMFAQSEQVRSGQAGSQLYGQPDWWAQNKDEVDLVGMGIKHVALSGKLELGADLTFTRSRSDITVDAGPTSPPFPTATTSMDRFKIHATYKLKDNMSITGGWWYERYDSQDWRLDGVQPATIPNLLAFGAQAPRYNVNVLSVALRYGF